MVTVLALLGTLACAVMAARGARLLHAALWLAATSVFLSLALYLLGADELAVIELSVGAGLVGVLFVFAIAVAGEDGMRTRGPIPTWLAWALLVGAVAVLGWLILPLPLLPADARISPSGFRQVLWEQRPLDLLGQLVLVFVGALGVVGLTVERPTGSAPRPEPAESPSPKREEVVV